MYSKVIFFATILCVVYSTVITFNNSNDDLDTMVNKDVEDCTFTECEQFCRGFVDKRSTCTEDRCNCDNFEETIEFASSAEEFESRSRCRPLRCNRRCLKVNLPGGTCVNGLCRCNPEDPQRFNLPAM